jgi:hypothetical protein
MIGKCRRSKEWKSASLTGNLPAPLLFELRIIGLIDRLPEPAVQRAIQQSPALLSLA